MFLLLEERVRDAVAAHIAKNYAVDVEIVVEQPPKPEFGELAIPAGFALAKLLRRPPRGIIEEIAASIEPIPGVDSIEPAGAGYVNVRFARAAYAEAVNQPPEEGNAAAGGKIIVEHTNINPNKAAHIGHLRNAVLGDTLVRMLRALGREVEVQNYIDNTGVQVADVVAAFHYLEKKTPAEVQALVDDPDVQFDYYCWDLYARISRLYEEDKSTQPWRAETLHAIEAGEGVQAEIGRIVADAIVNNHVATMGRIGVEYDVLPRESEILHLKFWASAFELLKERGAIYFETQGKNNGCWVMPGELFRARTGSQNGDRNQEGGGESEDVERENSKVIVRSDGTVTYVGKDIAYQLWKFGLLGKDFHYRRFAADSAGRILWVSSSEASDEQAPKFGAGQEVYNVIDVRQSYLQDVVRAGLRALGFEREADNSVHFSYEMVALSPRCCAELGIELSEEDRRRPHVEVSGRKGLGVKADDLIDLLIDNALEEVRVRHEQTDKATQREIATRIAVGALRYFMLKFTRTAVIAFDFQEALSFEGETGPYIQYAAVRARNILRKLEARGETLPDFERELDGEAFRRQLDVEDFWQLLLGASRRKWVIEKAIAGGEPAHLARYGFQLAQAFNNFYHRYHILNETDRERRVFLLWMTQFFLQELERVLATMGIPAPEVM